MEQYEQLFTKIADNAKKSNPQNEGDYIRDGLLYCGNCNTPKQCEVELFGTIRKPMCLCKCQIERLEREEEERKQREFMDKVQKYRRMGFDEGEMQNWSFKADDGHNEKITNAAHKYVENFPAMLKQGKGLLLYGTVGTGKTFFACCIANALIDEGYPCLVTNFARLTNTLQEKFENRQAYIDSLNQFALLVIDDLGAERKSEFMQEMVFNIIDARYRAGLPIIITTNLSIEEVKKPQTVGNARIYDRIIERCFPIEVEGKSRRREAVRASYDDMKNLLGL